MTASLVVGGSSGIGLATAISLAASGDTVHIAGRSPERLAATTAAHPELIAHQLDAADAAAAAELAASIAPIGRLIVTLSGNQGAGPLADLDLGVLRAAFEEKLWPTLTMLKAA